jgi:hypothetical protein
MEAINPQFNITIAGKKLGLRFDVNSNPTKKGVKMQFILDQEFEDPRDKQALTNEISVALQKRFAASGIMIDFDDRNPFKNVIGFIVPLNSVATILIKSLKGSS